MSFAEAYEKDRSLWEPAAQLAQIVGDGGRIWSLNAPYHVSMAPAPRIEGFLSFGMSPLYHEILFEPPEQARELLRRGGLDFFIVDYSMPLFDVLPHAPLFRPESIRDWLSVVWSEGDIYLLSWARSGEEPLSDKFLARYAQAVEDAQQSADWQGLHARVEGIYRRSRGSYPLAMDEQARPLRGFQ